MSDSEVMSRTDLTALLGQAGWTRRLARSLVSDVQLAEDLVQDAWVAALERPPDLGRPVHGWFASVLRHRMLQGIAARGIGSAGAGAESRGARVYRIARRGGKRSG